jgi:hypothetical protein
MMSERLFARRTMPEKIDSANEELAAVRTTLAALAKPRSVIAAAGPYDSSRFRHWRRSRPARLDRQPSIGPAATLRV